MSAPAARALNYWTLSSVKSWRLAFAANLANPILYLAALGIGLGSLVDSHGTGARQGIGTHGYVSYLAPALLCATALQSAVSEASYPVLGSFKWNRTYEAMLATPLTPIDVLRGHLAFIVGRTTLVAALFLAVMTAFGTVHSPLGLLCLPVVVLLSTGCAALMAGLSASINQDMWISTVFRLAVVPLTLFSGTFVPLSQLPEVVRPIAYATPLWHAVELARGACDGHLALGASLGHLAYLVVLAAAGYAAMRHAFLAKMTT